MQSLKVILYRKSGTGLYVILALRRLRQEDCCKFKKPGLHSKYQASQKDTARNNISFVYV